MVATVEDGGDVVLTPDPARCRSGRGGWLHPSTDCFEQAVRRRAFTRALRLASGPDVRPVREHLDQLEGVLAAPPPVPPAHRSDEHQPERPPTESGSDADEHPMSTQR
ncbi:MAG: YlxR family protein [Actinomycetota bacterium]|nr:YlxR family protein [Actinomycetota bacterium]